MTRLLLTSNGFANPKIGMGFRELFGEKRPAVLYVPTAANVDGQKWRAKVTRGILGKIGCDSIRFDLDEREISELPTVLDAIYIDGGNTFYLMKKARETGFDTRLIGLVNSGVIYVGASAGSIIAGNDTSKSTDENRGYVENYKGLGLVDTVICPHAQKKEKGILGYEKRTNNHVIRLNDGEALLFDGNSKGDLIK